MITLGGLGLAVGTQNTAGDKGWAVWVCGYSTGSGVEMPL